MMMTMPYLEGPKIKWREYSEEAFVQAKQELRPVFLLCYSEGDRWCRMYAAETLEDEEVAKSINGHFIPVFIDADKRRDLKRTCFAEGLPATVLFDFKGNELERFSGHLAKAGLMELLAAAAGGKIEPKRIIAAEIDERRQGVFNSEKYEEFARDLEGQLAFLFDELYGGFGKGRKFPNTYLLDYLAVQYGRKEKALWKGVVKKSLGGLERLMDAGEGGFFEYSIARDWGSPYFKKNLRENAAIADIYSKAGKIFDDKEMLKMGEGNLEWMQERLRDKKTGAFYGSESGDENYYRRAGEERKTLKQPFIDKSVYCDWNCEAAISFLHAHRIYSKLEYWEIADSVLGFVKGRMLGENGILHYYEEGKNAGIDGLLMDNAWAAVAFFEAYRVGKQEEHLAAGKRIMEYMADNFYSAEKKAFIERNSKSENMYRKGELRSEKILQLENAVACWALLAAYGATGETEYLELCKVIIGNFLYVEEDFDAAALVAQVGANLFMVQ
ncbi:MAG: DUF255 domain-containing protein [Candidatus Micrarchaeota archaeon]